MIQSFKHPFKEVNLNMVGLVKVDEKVVDLITALCDLGWITRQSCQNNFGRVWIGFHHANYASEFLELIARRSEKLRSCVIRATTEQYDKAPRRLKIEKRWWVDSYVNSFYAREWTAHSRIGIHISVRFPKSHLKKVTKIVMKERDRRLKFQPTKEE